MSQHAAAQQLHMKPTACLLCSIFVVWFASISQAHFVCTFGLTIPNDTVLPLTQIRLQSSIHGGRLLSAQRQFRRTIQGALWGTKQHPEVSARGSTHTPSEECMPRRQPQAHVRSSLAHNHITRDGNIATQAPVLSGSAWDRWMLSLS